ncbi:MAG TPA: hypothetical protein VJ725_06375 [Thermoanaerobaculia bacterium]|nr:hypothetical protein [Thermoanaerobaculia bacterium]
MKRLGHALRPVRLSLELLLGKRLALFAGVDALVVLACLLDMLLDSPGEPAEIYRSVVLVPFLLLGIPALSGLVDVERQAGCLDLALSSPSAEGYFVRRAAAVCATLTAQGWALVLLSWLYDDRSFPLLSVLFHIAVVSVFLGAVALFWAVRLRTAGAVWLATLVTVILMQKWSLANPIPSRLFAAYNAFLPGPEAALAWLPSVAVLLGGAGLFYLYARRRLTRPETML